ncbi:MAG: hypothetical protein RL204_1319 [Bacteroidota bacterium]|jgi:hypothetical protein
MIKVLQTILLFSILFISELSIGQAFDKTFCGQWAMTSWNFEFHKDSTFIRTSSGHFGNHVFTGTYLLQSDTIHIIKGFENTSGTLNEYYLLDKDSMLIDLNNFYDYSPNHKEWDYISQKRYDILKMPNMDLKNIVNQAQLERLVSQSIIILDTKSNLVITDDENIQIIRLINTIRMNQDSLFKSGVYLDFMEDVEKMNYEREISIRYDWIPNRGMGYYFQKLQVELGGSPHLYSTYVIE